MILSENPKFIFVHIPKNGGVSITTMLKGKDHKHIKLPHWHVSAAQIKNAVVGYDDYFSFAFVRHPLDRLYSMYRYNINFAVRLKSHPLYKENGLDAYESDFKTWLMDRESWAGWDTHKDLLPAQKEQQMSYITNNGEIIVDYVARFEDYDNEFNTILTKLNMKPIDVLHANKSGTKVKYKDMYDQEMLDFVANNHKKDMELFNYEL